MHSLLGLLGSGPGELGLDLAVDKLLAPAFGHLGFLVAATAFSMEFVVFSRLGLSVGREHIPPLHLIQVGEVSVGA